MERGGQAVQTAYVPQVGQVERAREMRRGSLAGRVGHVWQTLLKVVWDRPDTAQ